MTTSRGRDALLGALAALAPLALLALALGALARDPGLAAAAALRGSLGTAPGLEATLKGAVPLLLCGLAVTLGFRAGVFNLGAEGQLVAGAIAAAAVGSRWPWEAPASAFAAVPLELLSGACAGALWAGVACWLKSARRAPEVLATILLNFVALRLAAFLVDYGNPLNEASGSYPQSDPLAAAAELPGIPLGALVVPAGFVVAVLLAVAADLVLLRTVAGLELRLLGTSPTVARATGFSPARGLWRAFLAGGALAGLAGALGIAGVTHRLYRTAGEGAGYTAVAVALVARLRPAAVIPAALAFAALESGAQAAQREAGVPRAVAGAVEGLLVLAVLAQSAAGTLLAARAARRRAALEGPGANEAVAGPGAAGGPGSVP